MINPRDLLATEVKKPAVEISAHVIGNGQEHIDVYEDWARARDALSAGTQNRTCHGIPLGVRALAVSPYATGPQTKCAAPPALSCFRRSKSAHSAASWSGCSPTEYSRASCQRMRKVSIGWVSPVDRPPGAIQTRVACSRRKITDS